MSAQLLRLVAVIVRQEFEYDEELKHVAISDVDVTKDLSVAKVYFNTLFPEYKDAALKTLKENAPFIRSILSKQVRARSVPELRFIYDESLERGANMEELISQARATDANIDEEE
jgi:ribosome-binding factor A